MRRWAKWVGLSIALAALAAIAMWWLDGAFTDQRVGQAWKLIGSGDFQAAERILGPIVARSPHAAGGRAASGLYICERALGLPLSGAPLSAGDGEPRADRSLALAGARVALSAHRYADAEALLRAAIGGRDRTEVEARQSLALICKLEGRLDESRAMFADLLEMLPDMVVALREMHDLLFAPYPIEPMRRVIAQATESAPNDPGVWLANAHLGLVSGDASGATTSLERAFEHQDRLPLGVQPIRRLERQIAMFADNAEGLAESLAYGHDEAVSERDFGVLWSWVARYTGDGEFEARALAYRVETPPVDFEALDRLAELALARGHADEAREWSTRKAELQRTLEEYRDALFFDPEPAAHATAQQQRAAVLGLIPEQRAWVALALRHDPDDRVAREAARTHSRSKAGNHRTAPIPKLVDLKALLEKSPGTRPASPKVREADRPMLSFVDESAASGLNFQYDPGHERGRVLPETMGGGLAMLDYDRDGAVDVFAVQGGTFPPAANARCGDRLFRNRGDGTFDDVSDRAGFPTMTGGYSMGVAVGDIDNDGFPDLFVTRWRGYALYRNRGDGTFEDVTAAWDLAGDRDWPSSAAFADIDNDGDLDLYVCHYLVWDAANPLGSRPGRAGDSLRYNNPLNYLALPDHLFRNDKGRFEDISAASGISTADRDGRGLGVVAADFDADGAIDFYVANDLTANYLFRNRGDGTFEEIGQSAGVAGSAEGQFQGSMGVACADINGDANLDLAVTNFYGDSMALYHGLGQGLFSDHTSALGLKAATRYMVGWGIAFADFNNDGLSDLVFTNGHLDAPQDGSPYAMPTQIFGGRAGHALTELTSRAGAAFAKPRVGRALVTGDIDSDGRVDILIGAHNEPLLVLRNQSQPSGHFLTLELQGKRSNRDGVGARVVVQAGGQTWYLQRMGGGSYQSAGDPCLHIGLGAAESIDRVHVTWPSGQADSFEGLSVDRRHRIVEGEKDAKLLDDPRRAD